MSFSSISLPKPKNWQDFENQMWVLFSCVLNDPNTQKNGRSGQKQNGVDIFGRRNEHCFVGIQCKEKYDSQVTEQELRSEVNKSKDFTPPIDEFFLVTTAPRDQKVQEIARVITSELSQTDHPIGVYVWGWDDIEENATNYPKALKAIDPTWNPYVEEGLSKVTQFQEMILQQIQEVKQSLFLSPDITKPLSYTPEGTNLNETDENTPLHGQITAYQKFIDEGEIPLALKQLEKLKTDKWSGASRSERYRILVAIASAKLKLGFQEDAGNILLDAYNECPEHKKAQKNRATGLLLTKNFKEARALAQKLLEEDPDDAYTAGVLIQSYMDDCTDDNPLSMVPADLHETVEVYTAYANYLRTKGNSEWRKVAKAAAVRYPHDRVIKLFSAEAILDLICNDKDAMVGGPFSIVSWEEFNKAVDDLYSEAREALEKGFILPSTAHNSVLALRLVNDTPKATEILNAAIEQHPNDENLRIQRAVIAYAENDPKRVLEILKNVSPDPEHPEELGLIAWALADSGQVDKAISLISENEVITLPEHVRLHFLAIRIRIYVDKNERELALDTIAQRIATEPQNLTLRILQIRTYNAIKDENHANEALEKALALIDCKTALSSRLDLCFEARKLKRDDVIVDLLKGKVATDYENEGFFLLIQALINSSLWVSVRELLSTVSISLQEKAWFQRTEIILAFNTGDPSVETKLTGYLRKYPNDLEMILAKLSIWQREGRIPEINNHLNILDLSNIEGLPEQRVRLAALICQYQDDMKGLKYAYSILMNNWDNPQLHLFYQNLMFFNEGVKDAILAADSVGIDTVVCLQTESGERIYRIEKEKYTFFADERLSSDSDLGILLVGKKPGDQFKLQEYPNSKPIEVLWVKSIYLDALHRSLNEFNERFPRTDGLLTFKIDENSPDPIEDIRDLVKSRAERIEDILNKYRSTGMPLSFVAKLLGKDPIDVAQGLPAVNIEFQVCRGLHSEREDALRIIRSHEQKGCIVDAITLSTIYHLEIGEAITAVFGQIYTPQSVLDLLAYRSMMANQDVGRKQSFLGWYNGNLAVEEYSEGILRTIATERQRELSWAKSIVKIVPSIPKNDHSSETKKMIDLVGREACDPAVAADGNNLLLLSEDIGYRVWSAASFHIQATWLQPVLIHALNEGHISLDKYADAINLLVLKGHDYISLNAHCLMHQVRKDEFHLTNNLSRLLSKVGGPSADVYSNSSVLSNFIIYLWKECPDDFEFKRILSEIFSTFSKGRSEDLRTIVGLIWIRTKIVSPALQKHAIDWLIGHSIGASYFTELIKRN
ncbi:tetratricopeptide repeat protein [Desulfitobacterium hafniense]|nr:tetratricopeptide repeat protein [Desulfitobacterium hafniense]